MHRTLGVQEEKGSLLCPPEQNLVHRERKNGRATFKGALSTAPGHKEGTQQTWVLYPSSQLNCLEVFKQTKKKKKKSRTLLPTVSKLFLTSCSLLGLLRLASSLPSLPQVTGDQATEMSSHVTGPFPRAHHSRACPPTRISVLEASADSPTFSLSFPGSLAGFFFARASENFSVPFPFPHVCSQRHTHEPHSLPVPRAENPPLPTGPKSPSSTPDPYFLPANKHFHWPGRNNLKPNKSLTK